MPKTRAPKSKQRQSVAVLGMTSRQTSDKASAKDVTFAWSLVQALQSAGHASVLVGKPNIDNDYAAYDRVIVGLGPLHGLGTSKIFPALAAISKTPPEKLTLMVDDWDASKINQGIQLFNRDIWRLQKPFYAFKRDYHRSLEPDAQELMQAAVRRLANEVWPSTLVPAYTWFDPTLLQRPLPRADTKIVPLDPTCWVPTHEVEPLAGAQRDRVWITESRHDSRWFAQQRTGDGMSITRYGSGDNGLSTPPNSVLVKQYAHAWGMLNHPVPVRGWWSSRLALASQARCLVVGDWRELGPFGESYYMLPEVAAAISPSERDEWAESQAAYLVATCPTREQFAEALCATLSLPYQPDAQPTAKERRAS